MVFIEDACIDLIQFFFFSKNIFQFIFTAKLSHFLETKNSKKYFFQNCFCTKIFFPHFFLLQNLVTVWGYKIQKNIFYQIPFFSKNIFDWCFCIQNVTKFSAVKINLGKNKKK
jgi:hypothetical protein